MKVYEAINEPSNLPKGAVKVFLAGGITNCPDWQAEVIKELEKYEGTDNLVIFNPRRANFDITDPTATPKQIQWEFKYLETMDIFSMYFTNSQSPQPICFYELGRHLARMQSRFLETYNDRIIIGVEDGFSRRADVLIQSSLALGEEVKVSKNPKEHAKRIYEAFRRVFVPRQTSIFFSIFHPELS